MKTNQITLAQQISGHSALMAMARRGISVAEILGIIEDARPESYAAALDDIKTIENAGLRRFAVKALGCAGPRLFQS